MGLFSKSKVNLPTLNAEDIARQGVATGGQLTQGLVSGAQQALPGLTSAAQAAATGALDIGEALLPRIREGQEAANVELFRGLGEQERLATGDLAQRLEREASERLGTGITFDEERALREASRGAFTARGRFRDTASTFDELTRRLQADRQARMQNAAFAQNVLGFRSNLLQQPLATRRSMFLDPRTAGGIGAGQLFSAGLGTSQAGQSAGLGLSQQVAQSNQQAQAAQAMANRRGGFLGDLFKGAAAGFAGSAGRGLGANLFN